VFVSGQPGHPDFRVCDYLIICLKLDDPRHLQLPQYVMYGGPEALLKRPEEAERILAAKTRFCAFIVSSHNPRKNRNRLKFFERLSRYQRVDSAGRFNNNLGGPIPGGSAGKIAFLRDYKFNIAFENSSLPGLSPLRRSMGIPKRLNAPGAGKRSQWSSSRNLIFPMHRPSIPAAI
jgi:hypothetical protein